MFNGHAPLSRKTIERTQHGVVLEHRRDHAVVGAHHTIDSRVERRRRVRRKAHMIGPRASQQARELGTAAMDGARCIERT